MYRGQAYNHLWAENQPTHQYRADEHSYLLLLSGQAYQ